MNPFKLLEKIFHGEVDRELKPVLDPESVVVKEFKPGEPVENMVRAYAKNRRRFTIKRDASSFRSLAYTVCDLKTDEVFKFTRMRSRDGDYYWLKKPDWMSGHEADWAWEEIHKITADRVLRYTKIKEERREQVKSRERKRIIEIYKED